MRVEFSSQALSNENCWTKLDRLVYFFDEGRHLWHAETPETVEVSPWYLSEKHSRGKDTRKKLFEESIVRESYLRAEFDNDGPHSVRIVVCENSIDERLLSPDDAYSALNRPGYIAVEDAESDLAFINAIIQAFDNEAVYNAMEMKWIQLEHMGGCGQLDRALKRIRDRAPGPMRTVVLADSDRLAPGEEATNEKNVGKYCQAYGVEGFVLKKREAENYLTVSVLRYAGPGAVAVFRAFQRLTRLQKDYFDMKSGFPQEGIPQNQSELYAGVSKADIEKLKKGFGDRCWELFDRHVRLITKEDLIEQCPEAPDELSRILKAFERLI